MRIFVISSVRHLTMCVTRTFNLSIVIMDLELVSLTEHFAVSCLYFISN